MVREYSHLLAGDSGVLGIGKNPAKVESGLSGNTDVKVKTWGTRIFWSGIALFVLAFFLYQEAVKIYPGLDESWFFGLPMICLVIGGCMYIIGTARSAWKFLTGKTWK